MTSRERILAVVRGQRPDYTPLTFEGICHGILPIVREEYPDRFDRVEHYLSEGIDAGCPVDVPWHSTSGYQAREWIDAPAESAYPVFHKRYETPAGTLEQVVRKTDDYPEHVRVFSDHNVPRSRSIRYLVEDEADLGPLAHVLRAPEGDELDEFRAIARQARSFCDRRQVLMSGTLIGVGDPLVWTSGVENTLFRAIDDPEFLDACVEIIAALDMRRLEILIESGVDLVVRRGWYESADFWSPDLFRRFLAGPLRAQVEAAHQAGVAFVYVMNSGYAPLIGDLQRIGIDMLSNVDETTGRVPLSELQSLVGGSFALCGGVNNFEVIERGTADQVRRAVEHAMNALAPGGGFVLAPGDSILSRSETARRNYRIMVDVWTALREA